MNVNLMSLGSELKFGKLCGNELRWIKVSDNNDFCLGFGLSSVCFDMPEPDARSREHRAHGSNYYPHSNIDQWLNSTASSAWFSKAHDNDACPELSPFPEYGFLSQFSADELAILQPRKFTVKVPQGSIRWHGEFVEMERLVALPSVSELLGGTGVSGDFQEEGERFDYAKSPSFIFDSVTRTAVGPGNIRFVRHSRQTSHSYPPNRVFLDITPVVRVDGDVSVDVDTDSVRIRNRYILTPKNPFEQCHESEFMSLLTAF